LSDRLVICDTCLDGAGKALAAAVAALVPEIRVETASCLNVCDRPIALALSGAGRDSYLFAGVDPGRDVDDLAALLRLYLRAAPTITDARPAGRLRHCLVGRIPAPEPGDG